MVLKRIGMENPGFLEDLRGAVGMEGEESPSSSLSSSSPSSSPSVSPSSLSQYGLVGLHTCGNLSLALTNLFTTHPAIRFALIVYCCYSKNVCGPSTPSSSSSSSSSSSPSPSPFCGWAMQSKTAAQIVKKYRTQQQQQHHHHQQQQQQQSFLSESSLMTACHANLADIRDTSPFQRTFFRLLLQLLLSRFFPLSELSHLKVGKISLPKQGGGGKGQSGGKGSGGGKCGGKGSGGGKCGGKGSGGSSDKDGETPKKDEKEEEASLFAIYCEKIASKNSNSTPLPTPPPTSSPKPPPLLVLPDTPTPALSNNTLQISPSHLQDFYHQHHHLQKQVEVFWTLRSCFAEMVESFVLLDRLLSVREREKEERERREERGEVVYNLVRVFDASISPRAIALLGVRSHP